MVVVIDASNIRSGGGLTHLKGILNSYNLDWGFHRIIVYSNIKTLNSLPNKDWLIKETHSLLNKSFLWSFFFQIFILTKYAKEKHKCDIVFVPGGTFFGNFKPFVTMSRNMLPFELEEAFRYKSWKIRARFIVLFLTQILTFKRAKGIVFLTNYAKKIIIKRINSLNPKHIVIPHGIDSSFANLPKKQNNINTYSVDKPFRFLYISAVYPYKHQWNVAEAILKLRDEGFNIALELIGPSTDEELIKLNKIIKSDRNNNTVTYLGSKNHDELKKYYKNADAFIFASSCENMPNILIEAMTSGLPIASSSKGPMPEILGDNGLYFDPLVINSIFDALKQLILNSEERSVRAHRAYQKTKEYTWKECSEKTFKYLLNNINNENNK